MTETAPNEAVVEMRWQTLKGAYITIRAPHGSPIAERGPEELREAELCLQALTKILSPDEERASGHIVLCVDGTGDPAASVGYKIELDQSSSPTESDAPTTVHVVHPD